MIDRKDVNAGQAHDTVMTGMIATDSCRGHRVNKDRPRRDLRSGCCQDRPQSSYQPWSSDCLVLLSGSQQEFACLDLRLEDSSFLRHHLTPMNFRFMPEH